MSERLSLHSPVGPLLLEQAGGALVSIGWSPERAASDDPVLIETARQLEAYFAGRLRNFDLPLRPAGSSFEQQVWTHMRAIPFGQTRCYGELAAAIGSAARAVGRACGRNPIPIVIPCHRVLARSGLGGYSGSGGPETKHTLLRLEGVLL
jgi:methylated-DNA-[protein]-cysteine S-methyltransferase